MSRVCIVGAGAIGGFLGARLAGAKHAEVCALARGATLRALREWGWRLNTASGFEQAPARASDSAAELGVQDVVVIAVKGPALGDVAASIRPLIGQTTVVVPAMNGVPWWFCHRLSNFGDGTLECVDPGGKIASAIPFEQVLGCVVHASTKTLEAGVVQHKMGQGLIIGEPLGGRSVRSKQVVDLFAQANFDVTHAEDVRRDIWYKLWGNMTMNPVSALTGATIDRLLSDSLVVEFCSSAMREAAVIGERIHCRIDQTPEARHEVTARLGGFKTSMLQDVEARRPIELDALVTAVREIGARVGVPTPNIDALLGLTRLFGRVHGLYPEA